MSTFRALCSVAYQSLLYRFGGVALATSAVAISVFVLLSVEHVRHEARSSFASTVSNVDLIVGARTGEINLLLLSIFRIGNPTANVSWESVEALSEQQQVEWVVPISLGDSHRNFRVVGTTAEFFDRYKYGQSKPLAFDTGRPFDATLDVVVGSRVASELGYSLGDELTLSHGMADTSFTHHDQVTFSVSGVLATTGTPVDNALFVSLEAIEAIHADETSHEEKNDGQNSAHENERKEHDEHAAHEQQSVHADEHHDGHEGDEHKNAHSDDHHDGHDSGEHQNAHTDDHHEGHDNDEHQNAHTDDHHDEHDNDEHHKAHTDDHHDEHEGHEQHNAHADQHRDEHEGDEQESEHADDHHDGHEDHEQESAHDHDHHDGHDHPPVGTVTAILVGLDSAAYTLQIQRWVNEFKDEALLAILPGFALAQLWGLVGGVENVLRGISALVFISALFGLNAMMLASMRERKVEIEILRSIGARSLFIVALLVIESLLIVTIGVLLALASLLGAISFANNLLASELGLALSLQILYPSSLIALALIYLTTFVLSLVPAWQAYAVARSYSSDPKAT